MLFLRKSQPFNCYIYQILVRTWYRLSEHEHDHVNLHKSEHEQEHEHEHEHEHKPKLVPKDV